MDGDEQERLLRDRQRFCLRAAIMPGVQALGLAGTGELDERFAKTPGQDLMAEFPRLVASRVDA